MGMVSHRAKTSKVPINVYDPSGNKIGAVDHLMIDKVSGNVRYAVMSFGGFMGRREPSIMTSHAADT